jgi:hypothetical protein
LISFSHCDVFPSFVLGLLIALWYLLAIVLSVFPLIYSFWLPFVIFWPLCCLSFLWLTACDCPLVSFGHFVVCPSFDLRLLIVLWYLLAIVLSVIRSCKSKEGQTIQWPKDTKGQSEAVNQRKDRQHNDCPLVSFGHCIVPMRALRSLWNTRSKIGLVINIGTLVFL